MHMSYLRIIVKMRIFERKWNTTLKKYREIVHDIFLPFFFSFFFPLFFCFPQYRILKGYSRFSMNVPSCVKSTVERVFELRIKRSSMWRIAKRQENKVNKISGKENCHRFRTSWHLVTVSRTTASSFSRGTAIFCMTEWLWSKREVCINAVRTELDVPIRYFSLYDWYKKPICRKTFSTFFYTNFERKRRCEKHLNFVLRVRIIHT